MHVEGTEVDVDLARGIRKGAAFGPEVVIYMTGVEIARESV